MTTAKQDKIRFLCVFALMLIIGAGCSSPKIVPTLAPLAVIQESPVGGTVASQQVSHPTVSSTFILATLVPSFAESPTLEPTDSHTPTPVVSTREPTPLPPSGVNITTPDEGASIRLGQQFNVGGRSRLSPSETITVSLVSLSGRLLDAGPARIDDLSNWHATVETPRNITGPARIEATVFDENGQTVSVDSTTIALILSDEPGDRFLMLSRPQMGDIAVNGFNLLFDGRAQRPVNNLVTVSLWTDSCQEQVASQSFRLNGSGDWWGLLFVPNGFQGETCAVAHFGSPGDQEWREAQTLVEVLAASDISANAIVIALPRNSSSVLPGQTLEIKGLAYNAPDRLVKVTLMLDNGRLLNEGVVAADRHGFWELSLFVPRDAAGDMQIIASAGLEGAENYRQSITTILVER